MRYSIALKEGNMFFIDTDNRPELSPQEYILRAIEELGDKVIHDAQGPLVFFGCPLRSFAYREVFAKKSLSETYWDAA